MGDQEWRKRYAKAKKLPNHKIFDEKELQEAMDYALGIMEQHPGDPDAQVICKLVDSHRLLQGVAEAWRACTGQ